MHLLHYLGIGHEPAEVAVLLGVDGVARLAPPVVLVPPVVSLQALPPIQLICYFLLAIQAIVFLRGFLNGPPVTLRFLEYFFFQ